MSIYLARNRKMLTRLNGTRYFGSVLSPGPTPTPTEVTIGNQTWMGTNLSVTDGGRDIITKTVNYGTGPITEYYYSWYAAVRIANTIDGWHLPSFDEYYALDTYVGHGVAGTKLKSTYGWTSGNGTDIYGFSAFPSGYIRHDESSREIHDFGSMSPFWTIDESGSNPSLAAQYIFFDTKAGLWWEDNRWKMDYMPVRLIKDRQ